MVILDVNCPASRTAAIGRARTAKSIAMLSTDILLSMSAPKLQAVCAHNEQRVIVTLPVTLDPNCRMPSMLLRSPAIVNVNFPEPGWSP